MTSALAPAELTLPAFDFDFGSGASTSGAQGLLSPQRARPPYLIQGAAILLYVLVLGAALTLKSTAPEPAIEEPLELVMLPPPVAEPIEEPPPPIEEALPEPEEELLPEPPPPIAEEPVVAPVKPKPIPAPKKEKVVERKPPIEQPRRTAQPAPPRAAAPAKIPPNAIPSGYANQVHARIARVAGSNYPRAALARHESGRVSYHIVIGPSGQVISKSISTSGNAAFDSAAADALARAAPFPATGMTRPVALSGAITYRTR